MSLEARVQSAELAMASLTSQIAALESSGPVSGKSAGFEDFKSSVRTRPCSMCAHLVKSDQGFAYGCLFASMFHFSLRVTALA
jgi:hypothetical protein